MAATDCLDNVNLLLPGSDLELLLQEDGCLLIVAGKDLVDNVIPVATHVTVKETSSQT